MSHKTLILIPTYNEKRKLGPMCEQVTALGLDADIVFVDDASTDGSGAELGRLAQRFPRVRFFQHTERRGIGSALLEGLNRAYDEGYTRLVTLDCEFTRSPALIPVFLERGETADVVVGSRYLSNDSLPGWSPLRKALTNTGHRLSKHLLGLSQDVNVAFRLYNLKSIPRELFTLVKSNGYAFSFESMLILQRNGYSIAEVPVVFPKSTYRNSKVSVTEVRRSASTLLSLFVEDQTNPGRFRLAKRNVELEPGLVDPQNWNEYWDEKNGKSTAAYDAIATVYRNAVIKRRLEVTLRREFQKGARLLHAGCGSGQVDEGLHDHARITAVDISPSALTTYSRHNPDAEDVRHASIFDLPFPNGSFDGAYNLGVVEHFHHDELIKAFGELGRVIRPGGKFVIFWPHARATSVAVLKSASWFLNDVLDRNVQFHPPEVSLVHSREEAADLLAQGGFRLTGYDFGPKDGFVQAIVVATRN